MTDRKRNFVLASYSLVQWIYSRHRCGDGYISGLKPMSIERRKHQTTKKPTQRPAFLKDRREAIIRFLLASKPDGHDTYRSSDRYGVDGEVRQSSCLQHRSKPSSRQPSDACRAWKGLFFFLVQPFVLLHLSGETREPARSKAECHMSRDRKFGALIHASHGFDQP